MQRLISVSVGGLVLTALLSAQPPAPSGTQPIYRVTVVSRSLEAVNYEHRGGPTPIDFQGTVLMPYVKGTAIVESHRGSTSIDAKIDRLESPVRFGREYLTYVLWAISPEGRAKNLGEVLVNSSNKAHIKVTTDLQAFGLMITAEPYYSVTTPSDVVVAENLIRPDTIGAREEVTAKYELLPRGQYTMNIHPAELRTFDRESEKLPYDRYEAVLELYQAENAVQIARSLRADEYAADSFGKAASLLSQAQSMSARKMDPQAIVSAAREATQMAEDARTIALKRRDEDRHSRELEQSREQGELQRRAEENAEQARADAERESAERQDAERASDAARVEAERAEVAAERAQQRAALRPPPPPVPAPNGLALQQEQLGRRRQLLSRLNSEWTTRDTPRGLVVTIDDTMFEPGNDNLRNGVPSRLRNIASVLSSHPGLSVRVEGYADTEALSDERARAIRTVLVSGGAASNAVLAVGYGNSRPIADERTAVGHQQNRRVEIVISGDSIGNRALWDHPYALRSAR